MLQALRPTRITSASSSSLRSLQRARLLATEAPLPPTPRQLPPLKSKAIPDSPLRPHYNVEVDPNHGLWAFFRKKADKDENTWYETVEPKNNAEDYSGRAWTAAELRRKSFKDLHVLWYVVLREMNLLATQLQELARVGAIVDASNVTKRKLRCRKTMARIKYVINERRLAYEGAVDILTKQKDSALALREQRKEARQKARVVEKVAKEAMKEKAPAKKLTEQETAAQMAVAGVFDTVPPSASKKQKKKAKSEDDSYVI